MKKSKVVAVHLLNDFSGSPYVLRQSLEILVKDGYDVEVYTATPDKKGFLSDISGVKNYSIFYKWNKNRWITLALFIYSQIVLFWKLLFHLNKNDIVYINSLLPFGAALAGKFRGCKVIYHIHEVSIKPPALKKILLWIANNVSDKAVFVSNDLLSRTSFKKEATVVYNALPVDFVLQAMQNHSKKNERFTVLMLCSLKKYKGVMEFAECARCLPGFDFKLVLNATKEKIDKFFEDEKLPVNLELFPVNKNVHKFYITADVVVNLSLPHLWIETFGMTILEAMYYKKPVIVPNIGGVTELVKDGVEGYCLNPENINEVCERLKLIASDTSLYQELSLNAFKKAQNFTQHTFSDSILSCIHSLKENDTKSTYSTLFVMPD